MEVLYILVPITILGAVVIAGFFLWSVNRDQYDDLETEAHRILMDEDSPDSARPISSDSQCDQKK